MFVALHENTFGYFLMKPPNNEAYVSEKHKSYNIRNYKPRNNVLQGRYRHVTLVCIERKCKIKWQFSPRVITFLFGKSTGK